MRLFEIQQQVKNTVIIKCEFHRYQITVTDVGYDNDESMITLYSYIQLLYIAASLFNKFSVSVSVNNHVHYHDALGRLTVKFRLLTYTGCSV